MADERIEVEWIATAGKMVQVIDRLNDKFDKLEKAAQKNATSSAKGADMAANSFNKLEQELKENEAALKNLSIGTKEFDQQRKKVDQLRASLSAAKEQMQGTGSVLSQIGSSAVTKLAALAGGIHVTTQLLTAAADEFDRVNNMRMRASEKMQSIESSIAAMAINVGAENVAPARAMIEENASRLGVTQEGLASLLSSAISGGAKDLGEAMTLAATTLKVTAGDAAKATPILSGMMSLAATTGNRDFEAVLGQLSQFQKAARGEDLAVSINNMSTAMAAANTKGERIGALGGERTLEMSSVISQLLQDPKMAVSGTALRQLVQRMDAFTPQVQATLDDGTKSKVSRQEIEAFNALDTLDSRIQAMRESPEIRKQFLSTMENSEGKVAIRQIVEGTEKVLELEKAAAGIVTPLAAATKEFENLTKIIEDNTQNLRRANQSKAADQVTDRITALEGSAVETFNRTVEGITNASGLDYFTKSDAMRNLKVRQGLGSTTEDAAIATLEELKKRETIFGFIPAGGSVSESDRMKIDAQIAILQGIRDDLQALRTRQPQPPVRVVVPQQRPKAAPLPAETAP